MSTAEASANKEEARKSELPANKFEAAAGATQKMQAEANAPGTRLSSVLKPQIADDELDTLLQKGLLKAERLSLALDTSTANCTVKGGVASRECKADWTDLTRADDIFKPAKPAVVKDGATAAAAAADPLKELGLNVASTATGETNLKQQNTLARVHDKEEIASATTDAKGLHQRARELFNMPAEEFLAKYPGANLERDGEALIRRDASGKEIYRKEGTVTTLTVDGVKYVTDSSKDYKDVVGENGHIEMRLYNSNIADFPTDDGGALRYNLNTGITYFVDKDGKTASMMVRDNGNVVLDFQDSIVEQERTELDLSDPDKAYAALLARAQDKSGQITFPNGAAIVTKDENGKPEVMAIGSDGSTIITAGDDMYFYVKAGKCEIRYTDGRPPVAISQEKMTELSTRYKAVFDTLRSSTMSIKNRYGDSLVASDINSGHATIQAITGAITTVVSPDGTQITTDANTGAKVETRVGEAESHVSMGNQTLSVDAKGARNDKFVMDKGGKVTDRRNGTEITPTEVRTRSGITHNSREDRTTFEDGLSIDRHNTISTTGSPDIYRGPSTSRGDIQVQEARAMGTVAIAQSMAAEVLAKAASGRVTSSDIDALSATLGGLEHSIKMLANEVDPSAMVRAMITKSTVSESMSAALSVNSSSKAA